MKNVIDILQISIRLQVMILDTIVKYSCIYSVTVLIFIACSGRVMSQDSSFLKSVDNAKDKVYRVEDSSGAFLGTAFAINRYGGLLTCAHVVGTRDTITLTSYVEYQSIVKADTLCKRGTVTFRASVDTLIEQLDLAILSIDIESYGFIQISYFGFARSRNLQEGEDIAICAFIPDVFELPMPFVAKGIVSTVRNEIYFEKLKSTVSIIQMDLNVSKGTSGGPIFLPNTGRVIGIQRSALFDSKDSRQSSYAIAMTTDQVIAILDSLKIAYDVK